MPHYNQPTDQLELLGDNIPEQPTAWEIGLSRGDTVALPYSLLTSVELEDAMGYPTFTSRRLLAVIEPDLKEEGAHFVVQRTEATWLGRVATNIGFSPSRIEVWTHRQLMAWNQDSFGVPAIIAPGDHEYFTIPPAQNNTIRVRLSTNNEASITNVEEPTGSESSINILYRHSPSGIRRVLKDLFHRQH